MAPRNVRLLDGLSSEKSHKDVLDSMTLYAQHHQVSEILQVLMTRLLESQPLNPLDFLIATIQKDEEIEAIVAKSEQERTDTSSEANKKEKAIQVYKHFHSLEAREAHDPTSTTTTLTKEFLLKQLQLDETKEYLKTIFPQHYRDWIDLFEEYLKTSSSSSTCISSEEMIQQTLDVLSTMAGNK
jgi:hypothetical protein